MNIKQLDKKINKLRDQQEELYTKRRELLFDESVKYFAINLPRLYKLINKEGFEPLRNRGRWEYEDGDHLEILFEYRPKDRKKIFCDILFSLSVHTNEVSGRAQNSFRLRGKINLTTIISESSDYYDNAKDVKNVKKIIDFIKAHNI